MLFIWFVGRNTRSSRLGWPHARHIQQAHDEPSIVAQKSAPLSVLPLTANGTAISPSRTCGVGLLPALSTPPHPFSTWVPTEIFAKHSCDHASSSLKTALLWLPDDVTVFGIISLSPLGPGLQIHSPCHLCPLRAALRLEFAQFTAPPRTNTPKAQPMLLPLPLTSIFILSTFAWLTPRSFHKQLRYLLLQQVSTNRKSRQWFSSVILKFPVAIL